MTPIFKKTAGSILFVLGLLLAGRLLWGHLQEFDWAGLQIRPLWLAAALAVNLGYIGLYARLWQRVAEAGGLRLSARYAYGITFRALAYKYLPVRIAGIGYRLWAYHRQGGWPVTTVAAVLYGETALVFISGGIILILFSPWIGWKVLEFGMVPLLIAVIVLAGVSLLPSLLRRIAATREHWQGLRQVATTARTSLSVRFLFQYAGAWLVLGCGLWLTLGALGQAVRAETLVACLWAYPLAGLAGMLALFAPAGLGVREGVLALALGTVVSPAAAALAALAARILILTAELVAAMVGHLLIQKTVFPLRETP